MSKKAGPYIFIVTLVIVLIFVIGVRYGQKVEKINKETSYLLTKYPMLSPTPTSSPTEYKTIVLKTCGISFLIPNTLTIDRETSSSAKISDVKKEVLFVDCDSISSLQAVLDDIKIATAAIKFKNKTYTVKEKKGDNNVYIFILKAFAKQPLNILVSKTLLPLFDKTLEIIK